MDLTTRPSLTSSVGLAKLQHARITTTTAGGASSISTTGSRGSSRALPGQIINAQAQTIGTLKGARPNPLADVANWKTGGRKSPFGSMADGDMTWWYIGGAVLLAAVLMRRKK
jgi:hypothetical protein